MFDSLDTFAERHPILYQWKLDLIAAWQKHYGYYLLYAIIGLVASLITGFVTKEAQIGLYVFLAFVSPLLVIIIYFGICAPVRVVNTQTTTINDLRADLALQEKRADRVVVLETENANLQDELVGEREHMTYLEERLSPQIEWTFEEDTNPFVELLHYSPPHFPRSTHLTYHHVVRIKATNSSAETAYSVSIKLKEFDGDPNSEFVGFPFPTRLERAYSVGINAGDSEYFDIACYPVADSHNPSPRTIYLCHKFTGAIIPALGSSKVHRLTFSLYGNPEADTKTFELFVDNTDRLQMKEVISVGGAAASENN